MAHLGSLRPYKGFDTVVAAFGRALTDDSSLHLRVVGRASDEAAVRELLGRLPPDAVSFDLRYLTIDELVGEARSADVLLLGHRRASESGILHLALAAGTPVVGPDIAGIGRLLAGQVRVALPAGRRGRGGGGHRVRPARDPGRPGGHRAPPHAPSPTARPRAGTRSPPSTWPC